MKLYFSVAPDGSLFTGGLSGVTRMDSPLRHAGAKAQPLTPARHGPF